MKETMTHPAPAAPVAESAEAKHLDPIDVLLVEAAERGIRKGLEMAITECEKVGGFGAAMFAQRIRSLLDAQKEKP